MRILFTLALFVVVTNSAFAQNMYKPSQVEIASLPEWAQLMYSESPNLFEVKRAYEEYYATHEFQKSYHTQYYKRWVRAVAPWVQADGTIDRPSSEEQLAMREEVIRDGNENSRSSGSWNLVGPMLALDGGGDRVSVQSNIYSIDQSASNPLVVYCGTEPGEIYRSNDEGATWFNVSLNDPLNGGVTAIEIHPTNPDFVLAGSGGFIFKTTDGGVTWTSVLNCNGANEILFVPSDPNIVFAATNSGFYRSANGGANWTQLFAQQSYDVKLKPGNDNTVYFVKRSASESVCQFYRSTDMGVSFYQQTNGWFTSTDAARNDGGARLAVTPADPNRVYAYLIGESKADDNGYIGVYKSTDSGTSWTLPNAPAGGPYDANHINLAIGNVGWQYWQGFYNCAIMASNTDADDILVGGLNLWKSDDGGATFSSLAGYVGGPYNIHVDMQDFRNTPTGTWLTCDGGIYHSPDFFATNGFESRMNGVHSSDYWGFGSGWNEDVLIGGLYHNGNLAFHENYGAGNFLQLGGGEPASGYVNQGESRKVYSSDINGKILPLTIGDPIASVGFGIDPNESYGDVESTELEFDPSCYNIAYTGRENKLWKTEDGGVTFSLFHTFGSETSSRITYIEPSWSNPDVMYVCQQVTTPSYYGLLWRTTNGGANWSSLTLPSVNNTRKMLLQVDPENENNLWIAFNSAGNGNKVFKSTNAGVSWTNISTSALNGQTMRSLVLIGGTDGGVYVATDKTIFYRNNTMSDWEDYGDGLPVVTSTCIARPFYRDNKIRIASYGKGIWESELMEEQIRPVAQIFVDKLNFTLHCDADTFRYVDHSMINHEGATWEWTFQGGTPATGNNWNENVVYNAPGTYLTVLKVTNGNGLFDFDSLYITIDAYQPTTVISEGFQSVFPPAGFEIVNADNDITWELNTAVGGHGQSSQCAYIRGFDYWPGGDVDDMRISVNTNNMYDTKLVFDVAYARYAANYSDTLEVLASIDCGETLQRVYYKGGTDLSTAPDYSAEAWVPAANQWRTDTVDLTAFENNNDVLLIFRSITGWGQHVYLDNINLLTTNTTAVAETKKDETVLMLYPNPVESSGNLFIYSNNLKPVDVEIYSSQGKLVYHNTHQPQTQFTIPDLSAGSYAYRLSTDTFIKNGVMVVK
jgi:photosystem II stability/assembly factor-like uncharacterized protein